MKVLVACEESQTVCKAFRELGHEAYSCDIVDCSGGHPEWHIKDDAIKVIYREHWDLVIAHPPCTFLSIAGACNIPKDPSRIEKGFEAKEFFMEFVNFATLTGTPTAIENPINMKRFNLPPYTQLIRAWQLGGVGEKPICLWLYNLPKLKPTVQEKPLVEMCVWTHKATGQRKSCSKWYNTDTQNHSKHRSKTFEGVAKAMAEQWGNTTYSEENNND